MIERLRALGYEIATQQDALTALSGVVVSQAQEIDDLEAINAAQTVRIAEVTARLVALESRLPATFIRA